MHLPANINSLSVQTFMAIKISEADGFYLMTGSEQTSGLRLRGEAFEGTISSL